MNDIDLVSRHSLFMSFITTKPQYESDASSVSRKSLMRVEGDMFSGEEAWENPLPREHENFIGFHPPLLSSANFCSRKA